MAKQTLKEKAIKKERQAKKERGYKDYWYLLGLVVFIWILQSPAVLALLGVLQKMIAPAGTEIELKSHFISYGVMLTVVSVVGFSLSVLLLALDKRKASVIVSSISSLLILLICALVYGGYDSAVNTTGMNTPQIIVSYVTSLLVPITNAFMVSRRI